jgi:sulfide:quinone oxidoreductase
MKKLLILGAGSAGTMAANRLHHMLDMDEWQITMVDQDPVHYYQPGYLLIPFGMYTKKDVVKPKTNFIPPHVQYIQSSIEMIEPDHNQARLANGSVLQYDYLIIATGANIHPEETPGLDEHEWGKSIHTFYRWKAHWRWLTNCEPGKAGAWWSTWSKTRSNVQSPPLNS